MLDQLLDLLESAEIHDLGQPYFVGMPHHPAHPPYLHRIHETPGAKSILEFEEIARSFGHTLGIDTGQKVFHRSRSRRDGS